MLGKCTGYIVFTRGLFSVFFCEGTCWVYPNVLVGGCCQEIEGVQQWAFKAAAAALEVIPRTLAQNCGTNVVRVLTQLRVSYVGDY